MFLELMYFMDWSVIVSIVTSVKSGIPMALVLTKPHPSS